MGSYRFLPFILLYLNLFSYSPLPAFARGGYRRFFLLPGYDYNYSGGSRSSRRLFEDKQPIISDDLARGYMSNAELKLAVMEFSRRCSNISRVYSIGKSVNGVPLWVIEISDRPGQEEAEPAFKFIGNVHGDEPVGRELLIRLANWICNNYVKDPLARLIVENVHLHILPSMNPDGFSLRRRNNANDVDLNRDFPDQFFPLNDHITSHQPETRAIMKWLSDIHFTASASLHGGALVANYPWDGTENRGRYYYGCPDDDTFRFMASIYSESHYNMSLSKEFPQGITNGASWYPIYGGMQDWNYIHAGCFELTLEISDNKWPSADELPKLWKYNKMSLLNLVASMVKTGVHGRIFSSDSGRPLPGSISVKGINYTVQTRRGFADYHRLLAPRERYEVMAIVPGFKSKTTSISLGRSATSLDFILDPELMSSVNPVSATCDCGHGSITGIEVFWKFHSEVYFALIAIIAFLGLLLLKRTKFNFLKNRQLPKRPSSV